MKPKGKRHSKIKVTQDPVVYHGKSAFVKKSGTTPPMNVSAPKKTGM